MKRLFICLLAICVPAPILAQGETKKDAPAKIVVPFELIKTQHMVVNVKVNGKGPFRLVFDTGAPDSLVSNKLAKEAGLVGKGGGIPFFGARGQAKIKSLELGDLKAEDVSTMILDHPTVQAISNFVGPIEGILGFTFYARYKTSIDYEKKLLTFEPNTYVPGDVMQAMMKRFTAPPAVRDAPRILAPAGLLGIRVEKAKDDEAAGVTVKDVIPDSPAAVAGLKIGDRLLTLDGRWTDDVADCYLAASHLRLGVPVPVRVMRDGKKMQLTVTVRAGL
jgi:PDZ domain/Aspartyl protease